VALCGEGLQGKEWRKKLTDFFTKLNAQAGLITSNSYDRMENNYAIYKTSFERAILSLQFMLDGKGKILGIYIKPFQAINTPQPVRSKTIFRLPFKDKWNIFWGGDTKALNRHVDFPAQKNAFDISILGPCGTGFKTNGKTNEDYYAFGKEIIAPCDAEVVQAVDGIKDNVPRIENPIFVPGNSIILRTSNNEYILLAHFKQFSIIVKQGDHVKQGQLLGLCGNSGNSTAPHLHFHLQNIEDINTATGIKCYFDSIIVNGTSKTDYSPIKGDTVQNPN
jgi:murein DD-endopeptidase MepM/ murein hydrolase activator NlpD